MCSRTHCANACGASGAWAGVEVEALHDPVALLAQQLHLRCTFHTCGHHFQLQALTDLRDRLGQRVVRDGEGGTIRAGESGTASGIVRG